MNADLTIILTGIFVATASAVLGVFLVLRRMALMADAISHSVLPGIVVAFWLSGGQRATVPAMLGAAAAGLLTVVLVEWLTKSGRIKNDAAIGLVFPLLFSLGVLAVSHYFKNVHLDMDAVLYGEIAYAPFNPLVIGGVNLGAESLWIMGTMALLNVLFITFFYKELKLSTFDRGLAVALGFAPSVLHYSLMTLVSLTAVGAFQSVGAILIVAFLIVPPATAYLLTQDLPKMLIISALLGVASSVMGYALAVVFDSSIAAMMSTSAGVFFVLAWLFSPVDGLLTTRNRRLRQKIEFSSRLLLSHIAHHNRPVPKEEILEEFSWPLGFFEKVQNSSRAHGWILSTASGYTISEAGRTENARPIR